MNINDALREVDQLYIETAPLIYYVEENPTYVAKMDAVIAVIEAKPIEVVSSVILLAELLPLPMRAGHVAIVRTYRNILFYNDQFRLLPVSLEIAEVAADIRARYNLRTPDALHVATAIVAGCDAFLTNDAAIQKVTELRVLVLDELEVDPSVET